MIATRTPDPSPEWLKAFRVEIEWRRRWLRELADRICRTESGERFYYRVRDLGRQS